MDDQNVDVLELQPPQRGLHRLDDELTGEAAAQVGRGPALPEELTADDVAAAAPGFALQYRAEHHLGGAARKGVPRVEVVDAVLKRKRRSLLSGFTTITTTN